MEHQISHIISHYGYLGIFIALVLGIIGLPVPDETLLAFVGYNVFLGKMSYPVSWFSAFCGSAIGITISYYLGLKLGLPFLKKFGPKVHITEKKIEQTQALFNRIGPLLILIGYFIPGVRHVTAYLAGISNLRFLKFGIYAYTGALIWSFTFITLGKMFGRRWHRIAEQFHHYGTYLILLIVALFLAFFVYWRWKHRARNAQ